MTGDEDDRRKSTAFSERSHGDVGGARWYADECICGKSRRRAARYPGLLVFQEAFGVNAHIRDVTRRFAAQGFVAIAPELFHRTAAPQASRALTATLRA